MSADYREFIVYTTGQIILQITLYTGSNAFKSNSWLVKCQKLTTIIFFVVVLYMIQINQKKKIK